MVCEKGSSPAAVAASGIFGKEARRQALVVLQDDAALFCAGICQNVPHARLISRICAGGKCFELAGSFDIYVGPIGLPLSSKIIESCYKTYYVCNNLWEGLIVTRNSVTVIEDTSEAYGDSLLHFQWCRYNLGSRTEYGYRFMWSKDGKLRPFRGGARIPAWATLQALMAGAVADGWGNRDENSQS